MVYFRHWLREVPAASRPPEDGFRWSPSRDAKRRGFGKSLQRPLWGRHLCRCAGNTYSPLYLCLCLKKSYFSLQGKLICHHLGEYCFPLFLPAAPLFQSQTLKGLFRDETVRFKGLFKLVSCVASTITEIQGHCKVCRARLGGPRMLSRTTNANLDVVCALFVDNALILVVPKIGRTLPLRPTWNQVSDQTWLLLLSQESTLTSSSTPSDLPG